MQITGNKHFKYKRILLYYNEFTNLKIEMEESLKFMSYIFSINEDSITRILKKYDIKDFKNINLDYWDIDLTMIDYFAKKLIKEAQNKRKKTPFISILMLLIGSKKLNN